MISKDYKGLQLIGHLESFQITWRHLSHEATNMSLWAVSLFRAATANFLQARLPQWQPHQRCAVAAAATFDSAKSKALGVFPSMFFFLYGSVFSIPNSFIFGSGHETDFFYYFFFQWPFLWIEMSFVLLHFLLVCEVACLALLQIWACTNAFISGVLRWETTKPVSGNYN